MANNLTMKVLEIVLVQILIACALALVCTFQLFLHAFALAAGNWSGALHIRWIMSGCVVQMGSSLPSSSFHTWLVGLLIGIMDMHLPMPNYLLSVRIREDKVEMCTSLQVHTREVAGLEQVQMLTC